MNFNFNVFVIFSGEFVDLTNPIYDRVYLYLSVVMVMIMIVDRHDEMVGID